MSELMVAHLIHPIDEGTQFSQWPLYLKILPWFYTQDDEAVQVELEEIAVRQEAISVAVGEQAIFGTTKKKTAQLLQLTPELESLHTSVLDVAVRHGTLRPKDPVGEKYNPHVFKKGASILRPGGIVTIDTMSLIGSTTEDTRNGQKIIVKNYGLGHESTT